MSELRGLTLLRYERLVDRSAGPGACHPWTGAVNAGGYGRFKVDGHEQRATRVGWRLYVGILLPSELVRHRCDNPPCQNRDHWVKGTSAQNSADMVERGRSTRGERNAAHKLTEEQVRIIRAEPGIVRHARRFGVSVTTVKLARAGRTWGWLE